MKPSFIKLFLALFFISSVFSISAQKSKINTVSKTGSYPASFTITKPELESLLTLKPKDIVNNKNNTYLDKSIVTLNSLTGDMQLIKLDLNYFPNASLTVLVNGVFTTQLFILSDDNSVFYKATKQEDESVILTKCTKEEIISE